jgi:hypothetical protein
MKVVGDEEGFAIYFKGEIECSLFLSLLERHINLSIKDSMYNKGIFQEHREVHPTEEVARRMLEGITKGQDGED